MFKQKTSLLALLLIAAGGAPVLSQIPLNLFPGEGRFSVQDSESYTEIAATEDGYRTTFFVSDNHFSPAFVSGWNSGEDWLLFRFDESVQSSDPARLPLTIEFEAGFLNDSGGFGIPEGFEFVFEPNEDTTLYTQARPDLCRPEAGEPQVFGDCSGESYTFEYSLIPMPAPLPGDFNFSDTVDVEDFLVLQENFGRRTNRITWEGARWIDGDADFDDRVTVRDFLILSKNFGATREAESKLATVPEPSGLPPLVTAAAFALLSSRRQRR